MARPNNVRKPTPFHTRFWKKIKISKDGCWEWLGRKNEKGYGVFSVKNKTDGKWGGLAHRILYERYLEKIPDGLELDHLCRNRSCVNPFHLEIVTHEVNCQRAAAHKTSRTHCKRGHELNEENIYLVNGRVKICWTCKKEYNKIFMRRYTKKCRTLSL